MPNVKRAKSAETNFPSSRLERFCSFFTSVENLLFSCPVAAARDKYDKYNELELEFLNTFL